MKTKIQEEEKWEIRLNSDLIANVSPVMKYNGRIRRPPLFWRWKVSKRHFEWCFQDVCRFQGECVTRDEAISEAKAIIRKGTKNFSRYVKELESLVEDWDDV